jgi:hypothetical protein
MSVTSVASLNSLFNTIYERAIFYAREINLMAQLVDNRSASGWMNRVVPIRPQMTAATVGETQDYSAPQGAGKSTKATLTPQEVIVQAVLTDRAIETDPDSAVQDAIFEMGGALGTKVDVDLVTLFSSFTTDKGAGAGNSFTLATCAAGVSVLRKNHAMQYGGINLVLHPYHWHDIWVELGKPSTNVVASDAANTAMRDFLVQRLLGANWYVSANIAVDASDDAVSGAFVRPALMLDTRRAPRQENERDASARAWELNLTAGYAVGIVRQEFGVKLTADAAEPT